MIQEILHKAKSNLTNGLLKMSTIPPVDSGGRRKAAKFPECKAAFYPMRFCFHVFCAVEQSTWNVSTLPRV